VKEISIGEFARRSRLSLKALRLYDERGLLVPARVDQGSGYRYYDTAQLEQARLVVMLRELQLPLAVIKRLLACDAADAATRIEEYWRRAEAAHDARRGLADYLVNRLRGKRFVMYEVATREIPERSLLCLKHDVDEQGRWAFGKEFIAILRERPLPKFAEGREGAFFCIWWGLVSADTDGPMEWRKPVPAAQAESLASRYPELSLRTEPAHREAFVALPDGEDEAVHWHLAGESLEAWAQEQEHEGERPTLTPEDLGLRITYLASALGTEEPYRDMALPFAPER
jgi:DNA-binding transcriptional MerR regulator